jgi:hypothetical protein
MCACVSDQGSTWKSFRWCSLNRRYFLLLLWSLLWCSYGHRPHSKRDG